MKGDFMRTKLWGIGLALALSGCGIVHKEMAYPGGAPGALVDQKTAYSTLDPKKKSLNASGDKPQFIKLPKHMEVYRAVVAVALISKIGEATIRDPDDANAFLAYLQAVKNDINNMAGHLKNLGPNTCGSFAEPTPCTDYEFLFESDVPAMEGHMLRLGVAALPQREAASLLENVSSGNPLGIATSVWSLGKKSVVAGHNAAAMRRSEREIFAAIMDKGEVPKTNLNVDSALDFIKENGTENFEITPQSVQPLFFVIRDVCRRLPVSSADYSHREDLCSDLEFKPNPNRYNMVPSATDKSPN